MIRNIFLKIDYKYLIQEKLDNHVCEKENIIAMCYSFEINCKSSRTFCIYMYKKKNDHH